MITKSRNHVSIVVFLFLLLFQCVNATDNDREPHKKEHVTRGKTSDDAAPPNVVPQEDIILDKEAKRLDHMRRAQRKVTEEIKDPYNR